MPTKKAAIYDPYLDTLGGGERYCLTVAEILIKNGFSVDLFWSGSKDLIKTAQNRFSLNLENISIVPDIFGLAPKIIDPQEDKQIISFHHDKSPRVGLLQKYFNTREYDLFFYLSDGSVPFLFSKNNLLHIQMPLLDTSNSLQKLITYAKKTLIKSVVCNSNFTAKFFKDIFGNKIKIIYPPVDVNKFSSSQTKKKIILSVGRFDNILNAKKQDILINAFRRISKKHKSWQLILAGGSLDKPEKNSFLNYLKSITEDIPVTFYINPSFKTLKELYSQSAIYWHAAGFNVEEMVHPENTEHFGITVVEAMASGAVPLVVNKGGLPEIVNQENGDLWITEAQLISKTEKLINNPKDLLDKSRKAIADSRQFSKENFEKKLMAII